MAIEQWLVDGPKTIDLETVRRVRVDLAGGTVNIIGHDDPTARVEVTSVSGRDLKVAIDGDTLVIDHPQLSLTDITISAQTLWNKPSADISVLVPTRVDVAVRAITAEVLVVGVDGDIDVRTVGGEQFLDRTTGRVSLASVGGELSVRDHRGAVTTKTASGDVTVSGALTSFSGNTVTGSTLVDVTSGLPDRIRNASVSGPVTLRLPADAQPSYRVSSVTALTQLDDLVVQPLRGSTHVTPPEQYERNMTDVHLNTVGGQITVLRSGRTSDVATADRPTSPPVAARSAPPRDVPDEFHVRLDKRVADASESLGVGADDAAAPDSSERPDTDGSNA